MRVNPFPRFSSNVAQWARDIVDRLDDMLDFIKGDLTPNGRLITKSGRYKKITDVTTATYDAGPHDEIIAVNFAGAVTVTLPTLGVRDRGWVCFIYDASDAAETNNITIDTADTETINGAASVLINADAGAYQFLWTGTAYRGWDI